MRPISPRAAKAIAAAGGLAPLTVAGDLRTLAGCEQVFQAVNDKFKRCDVLVNNAGATKGGNFFELPDEAWTRRLRLKYYAAVRLTRLFWPLLKAAHGNIVNIIGGAARTPGAGFSHRRLGQCGLGEFRQGPHRARQPRRHQRQRHPSRQTQTDRVEQLFAAIRQGAEQDGRKQVRDESLTKSGLRRIGQPEDVAELALFLAAPRARHIQGTAIALDGGGTPGYY